jgi:hypothetical protein
MFVSPHQVALHFDHLDVNAPQLGTPGTRWTWIAGRRFRGVRWL